MMTAYGWVQHLVQPPQVMTAPSSTWSPGHTTEPIEAALDYARTVLVPKLAEGAHDEIEHLLHALDGGYIPPGPSGAPTRGMAHVLPTGRNFYTVDPRALPTAASWQVGQRLAADLVVRDDDNSCIGSHDR